MLPEIPVSRRSALHFFTTRVCAAALSSATLGAATLVLATFSAADAQAAGTASADQADSSDKVAGLLRSGGCVVLLRHAATDPGVGDPPEFALGDCRTQRNLSPAGQQDTKRIGAWFASRDLTPRTVRSSAWCRCKDTADLAFGRHEVWAALNSIFGDRVQRPDQAAQTALTALLRQTMARIPARQFDVWVTHQVNMSAIAGEGAAMGEALIVDRAGRLLARSAFV